MTAARGRPRHPLPGWALLLVLLTAAGFLLAGLVAPLVVATGLTAKSAANQFLALPTDLPDPVAGLDSRVLAADGSVVAVLHGTQNRLPVTIGQVPPVMQQAIVDIEDSRFYSHHGVDYRGLARAAVTNASAGGVQQGGSTLTEQYVKNVLLDAASTPDQQQAATGKSLSRKLREARYALALEQRWPKSRILEGYLNIAYFGNNAYGIGAAAQRYFGEKVEQLTLPQAAMLAGLVQGPSQYDPLRHPQAAATRRSEVLTRMGQLGHLTPAQQAAARRQPLGLHPTLPPAAGDPCLSSPEPFFCDYVRQDLLADPALGATRAQRDHRLLEGGLTIKTSLDPAVQRSAQQALNSTVEKTNRTAAVEVMVKPGTGQVLAMAVSRDYGTATGQTTVPLPTTAAFGPGSTFKTFTLTAALAQGLPLTTSFFAPACYVPKTFTITANSGRKPGEPNATCSNGFSNADPAEAATYAIPKATWQSVNTFYIQLEEQVGILNVAAMARTLGIPAQRLAKVGPNDGSLTLGTEVVSPLDMATAYATLAAHGRRCSPRSITSVTSTAGQLVAFTGSPPCQQVIDPAVADTVTSVLEGVLTNGTGYPNAATIGRPAAGKTGTNEGFSSAWFVGYTPQLSAAVELGDPRGGPGHPLTNITIGAQNYQHVFGGDVPARIWGRSMNNALAHQPYAQLPDPAADTSPPTTTNTPSTPSTGPPGTAFFGPNPPTSTTPTPCRRRPRLSCLHA